MNIFLCRSVMKWRRVFLALVFVDHSLEIGKSITIRRVVSMLGIPDALVPLDLSGGKVALYPG